MRSQFSDEIHCVICGDVLSEDRKKKRSITCTQEHAKERANQLRRVQDQTKCRYCRRPATPEERERFRRWRKWEEDNQVAEANAVQETNDGEAEAVESVD